MQYKFQIKSEGQERGYRKKKKVKSSRLKERNRNWHQIKIHV